MTQAEPCYSIRELAAEFGITTRSIRFYEEKGLVAPRREGQKRLYSAADRVRIQLILRGKRIGMTLAESAEIIDMYDPEQSNRGQLKKLLCKVRERRERLQQQQRDIEELLKNLDEVEALCNNALANGAPV